MNGHFRTPGRRDPDLDVRLDAFRLQRERIAELEEEIRQLREALTPEIAFPRGLRLTPFEGRLLAFLYARSPNVMSKERIREALYPCDVDGPSDKVFDVYISNMRKKLRPYDVKIVSTWALGWSIDAPAKRRLAAMISGEVEVIDSRPERGCHARKVPAAS